MFLPVVKSESNRLLRDTSIQYWWVGLGYNLRNFYLPSPSVKRRRVLPVYHIFQVSRVSGRPREVCLFLPMLFDRNFHLAPELIVGWWSLLLFCPFWRCATCMIHFWPLNILWLLDQSIYRHRLGPECRRSVGFIYSTAAQRTHGVQDYMNPDVARLLVAKAWWQVSTPLMVRWMLFFHRCLYLTCLPWLDRSHGRYCSIIFCSEILSACSEPLAHSANRVHHASRFCGRMLAGNLDNFQPCCFISYILQMNSILIGDAKAKVMWLLVRLNCDLICRS